MEKTQNLDDFILFLHQKHANFLAVKFELVAIIVYFWNIKKPTSFIEKNVKVTSNE